MIMQMTNNFQRTKGLMLFSLKQYLTSFGDKPLTNLYDSVARTLIFL